MIAPKIQNRRSRKSQRMTDFRPFCGKTPVRSRKNPAHHTWARALPVRLFAFAAVRERSLPTSGGSGELVCGDCGQRQPACPSCDAGWLVERRGRYGAFLSCVRFPECDGKSKLQNSPLHAERTRPGHWQDVRRRSAGGRLITFMDTDVDEQTRSEVHSQSVVSPNRDSACFASSTSAMAFLSFQSPEIRTPQ